MRYLRTPNAPFFHGGWQRSVAQEEGNKKKKKVRKGANKKKGESGEYDNWENKNSLETATPGRETGATLKGNVSHFGKRCG